MLSFDEIVLRSHWSKAYLQISTYKYLPTNIIQHVPIVVRQILAANMTRFMCTFDLLRFPSTHQQYSTMRNRPSNKMDGKLLNLRKLESKTLELLSLP